MSAHVPAFLEIKDLSRCTQLEEHFGEAEFNFIYFLLHARALGSGQSKNDDGNKGEIFPHANINQKHAITTLKDNIGSDDRTFDTPPPSSPSSLKSTTVTPPSTGHQTLSLLPTASTNAISSANTSQFLPHLHSILSSNHYSPDSPTASQAFIDYLYKNDAGRLNGEDLTDVLNIVKSSQVKGGFYSYWAQSEIGMGIVRNWIDGIGRDYPFSDIVPVAIIKFLHLLHSHNAQPNVRRQFQGTLSLLKATLPDEGPLRSLVEKVLFKFKDRSASTTKTAKAGRSDVEPLKKFFKKGSQNSK